MKKVADRYHVMHSDTWTDEKPKGAVEMVSNQNGEFDIYGLDSGIYYLKEIQAPIGYRPLLEPVEIEITATFPEERNQYVKGEGAGDKVLNLTASAHIKMFKNGAETEEDIQLDTDSEIGTMNLQIINDVGKKLPITGSYAMPILGVLGICLVGAAWRRGRKAHE